MCRFEFFFCRYSSPPIPMQRGPYMPWCFSSPGFFFAHWQFSFLPAISLCGHTPFPPIFLGLRLVIKISDRSHNLVRPSRVPISFNRTPLSYFTLQLR